MFKIIDFKRYDGVSYIKKNPVFLFCGLPGVTGSPYAVHIDFYISGTDYDFCIITKNFMPRIHYCFYEKQKNM